MNKKLFATTAIVVLLVILGVGFWSTSAWFRKPASTAANLPPMRLALTDFAGAGIVAVAIQNGYLSAEGLNVTVQMAETGKSALSRVLSGKADVATVSDIPIMFAVLDRQPVSVVATIFRASNDQGIVVRNGVAIDTPDQIKGKRVAVTTGTSGHFFLDSFLLRHRISINEVTLVPTAPGEMPKVLAGGKVDAVATWEPVLTTVQAVPGAHPLRFKMDQISELTFNVATTMDYAHRHPEAFRRLARALWRAQDFVEDHPDEARDIMIEKLKLNKAGLERSWPDYNFSVSLDQSLLLTLEDESRWAIRHRLTRARTVPNYLDHFLLDPLISVKPDSVSVIR